MVSPVSSPPVGLYRQQPDPGNSGPTPAQDTDAAIAKYETDARNGASASVLSSDRQEIDAAVGREIADRVAQMPGRDKTDRESLQQIIDGYGHDIVSRHEGGPAATKEIIGSAIDDYRTQATTWAPEDRGRIDAYIKDAMDRHGGDIQAAFEDLRDQRWMPRNFYDTNLAIAADYLRARWETQKYNNVVAGIEVDTYLDKKQNNEIPQNGPGPVSPYSDLQKEYMEKGVEDQWNTLNWFEKMFLSDSSVTIGGLAAAAFENDVS
jgi:hypothetical protein